MRRIVRAYTALVDRVTGAVDKSAWAARSRRARAWWSFAFFAGGAAELAALGFLLQHRAGAPHDVWVPVGLAAAWALPIFALGPFGLRRALRYLLLSLPAWIAAFVLVSWLSFRVMR